MSGSGDDWYTGAAGNSHGESLGRLTAPIAGGGGCNSFRRQRLPLNRVASNGMPSRMPRPISPTDPPMWTSSWEK